MPDAASQLASSAVEVLEAQGFVFVEPVEGPAVPTDWRGAAVRYRGPHAGRLGIAAATPFAVELAANMLGFEPEAVDAAAAEDALKELANILCGQVLTQRHGTEPVFDLGIPEVTAAVPSAPGTTAVYLNADDHDLVVYAEEGS